MVDQAEFNLLVEMAEVSVERDIGRFLEKFDYSPIHFTGEQRFALGAAFKRKWN